MKKGRPGMHTLQLLTVMAMIVESQAPSTFNYKCSGCDWPDNCQANSGQSPVDLLEFQSTCDSTHTFKFVINANITQVEAVDDPSGIVFKTGFLELYMQNQEGQFLAFDSHSLVLKIPSEHSVNGVSFGMELQVHCELRDTYTASVKKAVLSIFFNQMSAEERVFASQPLVTASGLLSYFDPFAKGVKEAKLDRFFANEVVMKEYYYYRGSETTPGCEETEWILFITPLILSRSDYSKLSKLAATSTLYQGAGSNNRELRPKGTRPVVIGGKNCSVSFTYILAFMALVLLIVYFNFKLL